MRDFLEYHTFVRRFPSPAAAALSLVSALLFVLPLSSAAQINAPPASVTSPGFGGRPVNGTAPSVTSVGPRGFTPNPTFGQPFSGNIHSDGRQHHRRNGDYDFPYLYAYPVPYYDSSGYADSTSADVNNDDADYQGGPTVFDRRGSGARSYIPPVEDAPTPHHVEQAYAGSAGSSDNQSPQPSTILVFKDGRKLEVGNYAIVGVTLFDLTPGHSRRIPLADLDIDATQKENDERGVVFQLPSSVQGD